MDKLTLDLLRNVMGDQVFEKPPELERAHCELAPKPKDGQPPRPIIACFHRYQEKEQVLRWARQHELQYRGKTLRFYSEAWHSPRNVLPFKNIKIMLYQKGIRFRFLYPARLQFTPDEEAAPKAKAFFDRRINVAAAAGE
ncbi:putative transposase element L1Md-A101/L1Md-A102/L1Md-A2 [Labeo rohita]|nr:putative transposase element L1Md-A101/L1Md-A102/L1Md-A2 [Labeo rohita]